MRTRLGRRASATHQDLMGECTRSLMTTSGVDSEPEAYSTATPAREVAPLPLGRRGLELGGNFGATMISVFARWSLFGAKPGLMRVLLGTAPIPLSAPLSSTQL